MPPDYSAGSSYHVRRRAVLEPAMLKCLDCLLSVYGTPHSLLDLGCGEGAGIRRCIELGIQAIGVDLAVSELEGQSDGLIKHDLQFPLDLQVVFEWVLCWEVAEHIDPDASEILCDSIVRHLAKPSGRLFFTAAGPGQRGPGHINCRPAVFWRGAFERRGVAFIAEETAVLRELWRQECPSAPWYAKNLMIHGWA